MATAPFANKAAMYKIQVVLNKEKIQREQLYDFDQLQGFIDALCVERFHFNKGEDGFYSGTGDSKDWSRFWAAIHYLKDQEWFLGNVETFLWFNNDGCDWMEDPFPEDLKEHYSKPSRWAM